MPSKKRPIKNLWQPIKLGAVYFGSLTCKALKRGDWVYLYRGKSRVGKCNPVFFEAHFMKVRISP
jgi:hypothetical protein